METTQFIPVAMGTWTGVWLGLQQRYELWEPAGRASFSPFLHSQQQTQAVGTERPELGSGYQSF